MKDDATAADYSDPMSEQQLGIAADVLRSFGSSFGGKHLALVGGIVPSLLVPTPPAGVPSHVGTSDLDLLISVALLEGDTADYYDSIVEGLRILGLSYDHTGDRPTKWRWVGTIESIHVVVEFLCPTESRGGRPRAAAAGTPAEANFGTSNEITALQVDMGHLVADDTVQLSRRVKSRDGLLDYAFPVAGLASWLALKADAIEKRSKPKDAYDVVWTVAGLGPEAAAETVAASQLMTSQHASEAKQQIDKLIGQFASVEHIGPRQYAAFLQSEAPESDGRYAAGAIDQFAKRWQELVLPLM